MGLVPSPRDKPRSEWLKVIAPAGDSSRSEVRAGLALRAFVLIVFGYSIYTSAIWFKPVMAFAALVQVGSIVLIVRAYKRRPTTSAA
jgi:hypothetical protein